jgi:UDP-N-acetyl-D-galactosamine dehydrogenase
VNAGLCEASSIRVAEVAKLVENTQRDLNIALMNEVAMIVNTMGISAAEVLRVAGTKWNFLNFKPGLVGGHCVPIDPHYLIHTANENGCSSELISCARSVNDRMYEYIVRQTIALLGARRLKSSEVEGLASPGDSSGSGSGAFAGLRVGVFGITFKGDCPDIRESQPLNIVQQLESAGFQTVVHDPLANPSEVFARHGIKLFSLDELSDLSAIIVTVPHKQFTEMAPGWFKKISRPQSPIIDVPGIYNVMEFAEAGLYLWQL